MYFYRIYLAISLVFSGCCVSAINFDIKHVVNIKLSESEWVEGSYFGYSLLLQKGSRPQVIVGAPKYSTTTGGRIFSCDVLGNTGCNRYSSEVGNNGTVNGNFFGSAIDGSEETGKPFVACAPRKVQAVGTGENLNYFLKGSCYYHRNSSTLHGRDIELYPLRQERPVGKAGEYYYDNAFGQAGIDLFYNRDTTSVLLGATGIKNWNGAIIIQSLRTLTDHRIVPRKTSPILTENYEYLGYKVGVGSHLDSTFLYAGAPRADDLLGKVKLFNDHHVNYRSFKGDEMGAYFGSAVLAYDVNDDGADDLFIGAPTAAGSTFEEGCAYFYKNAGGTPIKLVGKGTRRARFGTNIVALGDIDLDSYNDIAIAAPFENDGVGVVYIFMGTSDGITNTYSQLLVPSSFPDAVNVRGFGIGISRGNDIDGNGHNDLAIGAYKSGHVFVIQTKSVIDFRTTLDSNMTAVTATDNDITLQYCVNYKPRTEESNLQSVDFYFKLTLDYRVKGSKLYTGNMTAFSEVTLCNQVNVKLEKPIVDIQPFKFVLNTEPTEVVFAKGTSMIERSILYSHGCGSDNICQTQILIDVVSDTKVLVLGLSKKVKFNIKAENVGEPGYQCNLYMEIPKELELSDQRKCNMENATFVCLFDTKLFDSTEKEINFDVKAIHPTIQNINISFELKCLGENIENKEVVNIGIVVRNTPYIEGKSDPEDFEFNDEHTTEDEEIILQHLYTLGNSGPSSIKSDVYLLIPQVEMGDTDLFQLVEAKGILEGTQISCYLINSTAIIGSNYGLNPVQKASTNRTIVVDCFVGNKCLTLFCEGDYLDSSSDTAKYSIKIKTSTKLLANYFLEQPDNKNVVAFVTSAFLFNGTRIEGHTSTLLLSLHATKVPLWVYILSAVIGILLLCLLIFVFYKCHFFERHYKEKMNGERLMDQNIEMEQENQTSDQSKKQEDKSSQS